LTGDVGIKVYIRIQMPRRPAMTQKLWNTCKKCGCEKPEDTEKLCEQCKANRRQFWSDLKKVGGVAAGALLVVIAGGKMRKK
jgi:hypothetical protein